MLKNKKRCINIWYLFFFFWLTSLCVTNCKFIHITTNDPVPFLLYGWLIFQLYVCQHLHSLVDGHLVCFHVLAYANSAAVNTGVHVSFWTMVFSGYMLSSEIADEPICREVCREWACGHSGKGAGGKNW